MKHAHECPEAGAENAGPVSAGPNSNGYDRMTNVTIKKGKSSPYSIAERRVPEMIPVLGSQPAGDVSHKPGRR